MPRRPISYCTVNDCDLRVAARGLCRKHYWRMRLTGTTDDPTPPRNQSPCAVDDCGRPARSRGWCATHYTRWQVTGDPTVVLKHKSATRPQCKVDDCDRPAAGAGYCDSHYRNWRRNGTPLRPPLSQRYDTAARTDWGKETARCHGANHKHYATIGRCDDCGEMLAKIEREGRHPYYYYVPAGRNSYDSIIFYCFSAVHVCDPERRSEYTAAVQRALASGEIRKGQTVTVVKGRKVAKGTTGTIIWVGEDDWGNTRIGIKDSSGTVHWTAASNVEATTDTDNN